VERRADAERAGGSGGILLQPSVTSRSIAEGTYTGKLFDFHPTLAASIERAKAMPE
jgi:hypothetical protein